MKYLNVLLILILAFAFAACGGAATGEKKADDKTNTENAETKEEKKPETSADSPTKAVQDFVAAYKAKDIAGLKKRFSKGFLEQMEKGAKSQNKDLDASLKEFVEIGDLPFEDGVPETRNEKIDGDTATLEVNAEGKWEETPFIKEDGVWKIAFDKMQKN
jgi:ketosteroid isomerase-like protein